MPVIKYTGVTENITDAIGDTPLLHLRKIGAGLPANIYVKCEHLNPSGSYKDRMALSMIEDAERSGRIKPGQHTLTDSSAGNTSQALAMWGAVKGYKVKIRMGTTLGTHEKTYPLERYGADIELVQLDDADADLIAKGAGLQGATIEVPGRVKCLLEEQREPDKYHWIRQGLNPANTAGQAEMGREMLAQLNGKVDVFIAAIGTGGAFLGVSQVLKAANPNCQCIAVLPGGFEGFPNVFDPDRKLIPGINDGITKEIIGSGFLDEVIDLGNEEAREMAHRLSREEGLYVGVSSGANVLVATMVAKREGMAGKNIVTLLVDRGDRNLTDERFIT